MNFFILKTEPSTYSWDDLVKDKHTAWTGIRNYQARNNLRTMKEGDICFIYHSGDEKSIVGIAEVIKPAYQDPTTKESNWVCVDIRASKTLKASVRLKTLKEHPMLNKMLIVRHSRLSVIPISENDYKTIIAISNS